MIVSAHLVINDRGAMRVVKNRPWLNNNEIAVQLRIDVPKEFFERLVPVLEVELPKDAVTSPDAKASLAITADSVAKALKLNVHDVYDGLDDQLKRQAEKGRQTK